MKYTKKPVIIEAYQYLGYNKDDINLFFGKDILDTNWDNNPMTPSKVTINTLEGRMEVSIGDYIVRGLKGEYYPCKPDIFELTYEKVE